MQSLGLWLCAMQSLGLWVARTACNRGSRKARIHGICSDIDTRTGRPSSAARLTHAATGTQNEVGRIKELMSSSSWPD